MTPIISKTGCSSSSPNIFLLQFLIYVLMTTATEEDKAPTIISLLSGLRPILLKIFARPSLRNMPKKSESIKPYITKVVIESNKICMWIFFIFVWYIICGDIFIFSENYLKIKIHILFGHYR